MFPEEVWALVTGPLVPWLDRCTLLRPAIGPDESLRPSHAADLLIPAE